jgi:MFS family permease
MLMLDIAVVNTALADISADLDTGLSGLQWVVDAYTLALASVVLSAGLPRRPARAQAHVRRRPDDLHRDLGGRAVLLPTSPC